MIIRLKSLLIIPIIAILLLFSARSALAEEILEYKIDVNVDKSSKIDITEAINYDFGTLERRGIFREIPVTTTNKQGEKYRLQIDIQAITNSKGEAIPFSQSTEGENLIIKIGDANKTITGVNTYVISYSVLGAVTYFSDHDELYWNAIGTNWQVPIYKSQVNINLSGFPEVSSNVSSICFTGGQGSTSQECEINKSSNNIINISSSKTLMPYEGLTFAISLPQGTLDRYEPQAYTPPNPLMIFLIGLLINAVPGIFMIGWWYSKGRDPKDDRVLVRMYDAPKDTDGIEMTPLELGTIVDENVSSKDTSAEIINLAIHKYLLIKEDDKKRVTIQQGEKLKNDPEMLSLKPHQAELIKALDLHNKEQISLSNNSHSTSIASKITTLHSNLYRRLTEQRYFKSNPQSTRLKYFVIGFLIMFVGLIVPGIITLIFAYFMPSKTTLGVEAKRHGLGLKQFLNSQDRQFEFQEKNFYLFEKLLPYAISFNVAKIWAKKFEDLYNYKPDWYQSNSMKNFTTYNFVNSLENNLRSVESNYTTTTSSTGHSSGFSGGSSGGGGGGGGGGSW